MDSKLAARTYLFGLSKRQWTSYTVLLFANFLSGIVYSLKGPFYPPEAEKKGASATQYGLVIGIFELIKFFASPAYGHFMEKLGTRNVMNIGILTVALCSIFFGMLDRVDNVTSFVTYSFLIRILEACGSSAFSTAAFTTIICEFPDSIATAFASFETAFGVGWLLGPVLGGVLFEIGDFPLPFMAIGAMLFISFLFIFFLIPAPLHIVDEEHKGNQISDVFKIVSIPAVLLASIVILTAACGAGFINATLEPHIRQFQLTPLQVALVFVLFSTVYAIFAPIWGYICDHFQKQEYVLLSGTSFNTIAYLLIGPAPFFDFDTNLWVTSVGLMLHGLGVAAVFVSGFSLALKYAIKKGFPDNVQTYSVISGLWISVSALGMFVGPSAAGLLKDLVGFRWGSLFPLVTSAILVLMLLVFIFLEKKFCVNFYCTKMPEREHLLITGPCPHNGDQERRLSESYGTMK